MAASTAPRTPPSKSLFLRYAAILIVILVALGMVAYLVFAPGTTDRAVVVETLEGEAAEGEDINRAQVIDALDQEGVEAREGYRYRVVIDDEAREGTAGIARIGGLVTFVAGARKGEEVVVEVTRVKRTTAEAVVVKHLSETAGAVPPAPEVTPADLAGAAQHGPVEAGTVYRARIEEMGSQGDGIARIDGMVVFVGGAPEGKDVAFEVTDVRDRYAVARFLAVLDPGPEETPFPASTVASKPPAASAPTPLPEDLAHAARHGPVEAGSVYQARIEDMGRKGDGIARIDGMVVFIADAPQGKDVAFEVTEVRDRHAVGRFLAVLEAQPEEPNLPAPAAGGPEAHSADAVQAGAIFDVEVAEKDRKNPEVNGVARIEGLVVFVPGTQPGDRVRIRITERASRFAFSEVLEPLAESGLPE